MVAGEGQAGFYADHALTDSGYRTAAEREYQDAINTYNQYITQNKAGQQFTGDIGAVAHVLIESLWQEYGFTPLRSIDNLVQTGQLRFAPDTPNDVKNGVMAYELSLATHQNILPFVDANYIPVSTQSRQMIVSLGFQDANIPIAFNLDKDQIDPSAGSPFQQPISVPESTSNLSTFVFSALLFGWLLRRQQWQKTRM